MTFEFDDFDATLAVEEEFDEADALTPEDFEEAEVKWDYAVDNDGVTPWPFDSPGMKAEFKRMDDGYALLSPNSA